MRTKLFSFFLIFTFNGLAQKNIRYTLSDLPIFITKSGDTLGKALIGGLNQPQFQSLDINNDGKKDLIIHDRSGAMLPFINIGNNDITTFKYSPNYVSAFPKMDNTWFLLVDYDKDGREDLWTTLDFKTILFKNITKPNDKTVKFFKTALELKAYNFGTPPLDSVSVMCDKPNIPTIADVDGDGDIDIFSAKSNIGELLLYRNMTADFNLPLHPPVFDLSDFCWGSFIDTTFDEARVFPCKYKYYRKKHFGGNTLLWMDNDNDGDMDLLMGNYGGKNLMYLENGKANLGLKRDSIISYTGHWPANTTTVNLNSFPGAFMLDADGDGLKDILVAPNAFTPEFPKEESEQVLFYKNTGSIKKTEYTFIKKNYFTDELLDHGAYSDPILLDIDGDKDLDLIISTNGDDNKTRDKNYRLIYYENIGNKNTPVFKLDNEDLWGLSKDSIRYLAISFGDLDGDSKTDMLAGNFFGSLSFYKNIGTDTTWAFSAPVKNYANISVGLRNTPQIIDLNNDGLLDLVIGELDGNFGYYKNTGTKIAPKFTKMDDTLGNVIVNEITNYDINNNPVYFWQGDARGQISDIDNDGKKEMVCGGYEGKIKFYKFDTYDQKKYLEDTTILFDSATMRTNTLDFGTQSRPAIGDLDGDGINDIVVGNNRGGIHFLKGSMVKAEVLKVKRQIAPNVFPNPNDGNFITITKPFNQSYTFSLLDLSGHLLQTEVSAAGTEKHQMKLNSILDGIYILQSTGSDNVSYHERVIVLKGN